MGRWCVSFCRSIMNNWAPPWYPIPQHEYSGAGGVSWERWEPPLYPCSGSHHSFLSHLSSPLCFLLMHAQAYGWGQWHLGTAAYRSDAWLSIAALRRGRLDWLHYCGFVWVFNWLINCGPRLRCDWLWVVSGGLESGCRSPQGERWALVAPVICSLFYPRIPLSLMLGAATLCPCPGRLSGASFSP